MWLNMVLEWFRESFGLWPLDDQIEVEQLPWLSALFLTES